MKIVTIILTVFLFTVSNCVTAQNEETDNRDKIQVGLKAGLNYSNVFNANTEDFDADAKLGFAAGGLLRIPIGVYLGFQPEFLISQKGFKGTGSLLGSEYNMTRTTTHIDIPLQLVLKPSEFISLLAGPQYSYLLKQKDKFRSSSFSYSHEQEFENDNIRKNIFGFVAGVDINLKHVVLGARMAWDLRDNRGDGSSSTPQYKNMLFQATIGYTMY